MKPRFSGVCFAFVTAVLACACNKTPAASDAVPAALPAVSGQSSAPSQAPVAQSDREAITAAIQQHLSENKGINMSAMSMNLGNISVNGDQAQADAEFLLKQGGTSMLITYYLDRHAGGWIVTRNQPRGDSQFAHPPMDQAHSGAASPGSGKTPATSSNALPDVSGFFKNRAPSKSN
jgi:hypothetical protein